MAVHLMPRFIADLQRVQDGGFARRVLTKTLSREGAWTHHGNDHRYNGIDNAWIRYVSQRNAAYRVIYIRLGEDIYLYRAGPHSVEDRLATPRSIDFSEAVPVNGDADEVEAARKAIDAAECGESAPTRFLRRRPDAEIHHRLVGRRNLPHKEIWLVSPVVDPAVLSPTASLGGVLSAQVEDGAKVSVVTTLPIDGDIAWMENLAARHMEVFVHPRLNTKLYCFEFDEDRRFARGVPEDANAASLIMVGSSDLTAQGVGAAEGGDVVEELCYSPLADELDFVVGYLAELIDEGFELEEVRRRLARGQANTLTGERK